MNTFFFLVIHLAAAIFVDLNWWVENHRWLLFAPFHVTLSCFENINMYAMDCSKYCHWGGGHIQPQILF